MDIRLIVFGMVAVLAVLFIGAKLFIPREKNNTKAEADYVESALRFKSEPSHENYDLVFKAAGKLRNFNNADEMKIQRFLEKQKILKP